MEMTMQEKLIQFIHNLTDEECKMIVAYLTQEDTKQEANLSAWQTQYNKIKKESLAMLRILYALGFDIFFIYSLIEYGDEMGNYIFIPILFIALFTWGLIWAIKERFG